MSGPSENIHVITSHLSHPAPILEHLSICCNGRMLHRHPALPPTLFNGDLSSLCKLFLVLVRAELPWRNMINLTSFTLSYTPPGTVSIGQLLDFFESAPYLEEVDHYFVTPTAGAQNCRLVSLAHLKHMYTEDDDPHSALLDHLLFLSARSWKYRHAWSAP